MKKNIVRQHYIPLGFTLIAMCSCISCAGPSTPLGAPWATDASQVKNGPLSFIASIFKVSGRKPNSLSANIRLYPQRQILHRATPMTVVVDDLAGIRANYKLVVRYNGLDVTPSFLRQASLDFSENGKQLIVKVPTIRLAPGRDHLIEIVYGSGSVMNAYARLSPPHCSAIDRQKKISTTESFAPHDDLVDLIKEVSKQTGFNPAFTAALIAQESSFNPSSISVARAIGLTQVTPVADQELFKKHSDWPRYPGLNEMTLPWIKLLMMTGAINPENEWRLNPRRSIQGGLNYAELLLNRWTKGDNTEKIRTNFEDPDIETTKLMLASYHSGYARVNGAFSRLGRSWLTAPELNEARKYVNRVFSFCDHFSIGGTEYESET